MSEERYVTLAEVREMLVEEGKNEKRSKEPQFDPALPPVSGENEEDNGTSRLIPIQRDALEHAVAASKISGKDAKKLVEELSKIPCCKGEVAYKIADILPKYPEDVHVIFAKERVKLEADDITKIIDTVNKYL